MNILNYLLQAGTPLGSMYWETVLGNSEIVTNDANKTFRVERREVEVLQTESERVFVRGTLLSGDRLIVNGNYRLVTGQLVRPVDTSKISTSP